MSVNWTEVASDVATALRTIDAAIDAAAATGLPEAALIAPLADLANAVAAKLASAAAGNLSFLQATVQSVDASVDAEITAKFPAT
jgi:hypothetical protein